MRPMMANAIHGIHATTAGGKTPPLPGDDAMGIHGVVTGCSDCYTRLLFTIWACYYKRRRTNNWHWRQMFVLRRSSFVLRLSSLSYISTKYDLHAAVSSSRDMVG